MQAIISSGEILITIYERRDRIENFGNISPTLFSLNRLDLGSGKGVCYENEESLGINPNVVK